MSQIRKLLIYVKPYRVQMAFATLALIVASLITLALPVVIQNLVDSVFVSKDLARLNVIGIGLLVLFVIQSILSFAQGYLLTFVAQRVVTDLRTAIQHHLLELPLQFFSEQRIGEMVSRVTNDVTVLQGVLTEVPINMLRQLVTFVGGLTLMLVMNWQLTLIVIFLIPPLMAIALFFGKRLEHLSTVVQDRLADATSVLEEAFSGIRVVKSFTQENYEQNRFRDRVEAAFQTVMQRTKLRATFIPMISFLGFASLTLILWYGGRQVIEGVISPGQLIAFLFYMVLVAGPLGEFAGLYSQIREAIGAAKRIFEIMEANPEPIHASSDLPVLPPVRGEVRFEGVSFAYADDLEHPVLAEIDLTVQPDQVVALVGPSGVGKTTLVNLIPRFFEPTRGRILIDGNDIAGVNLKSLRSQIGLVPQETFLFGGSVQENIAYGRPETGKDAIVEVAKAAYAHEFISNLPDGYDTLVGERGVKLSAGQRQRLAIARALLKDPRILILDEATSALDTESEHWVQAALEILMEGRTTFVIAHRLSTIQRADRILVLQDRGIEEDGTHETLLARGGLYHRLWSMQFADGENVARAVG